MTSSKTELKDFVTQQAAEDAHLSAGERSYQEELVTDVLNQEAPNSKTLTELLDLYRAEKRAN